jgi:hypothetical protein
MDEDMMNHQKQVFELAMGRIVPGLKAHRLRPIFSIDNDKFILSLGQTN